jgi:4-hydroxy-4-methyl-2-oxoglutarate aldolase
LAETRPARLLPSTYPPQDPQSHHGADRSRIIGQFLNVNASNVSDALDRLGIEGTPAGRAAAFPDDEDPRPGRDPRARAAGKGGESTVSGTLRAIMKGGACAVLVVDASENPKVNSVGGVAGATAKHLGLV